MGSHASAQSKSPLKKYDFSPLERKIQGWIDSGYYPRASILIARNNQIIYRNYCGNYKPETVAYIAFESN
ncbi:hypothetical protein ADIARSV_2474 [Arcticibacter svalbardensis MN12-7]|uniref:Beta-lactamase n=2 Tax=Arcticibacter TaxID=1288026 RepID=R9GZE3_9SPHI|nr:hypothetical protein ADIARSV_2474 [Arcticibacter svalbardensis MN12-7]